MVPVVSSSAARRLTRKAKARCSTSVARRWSTSPRTANGAPDDASVFGLSDGQIHRIIRKRAEEAGIERAGGHSLRVGTAQDLAAAGAELPAIMVAGRWKDAKQVSRYTRSTDAGRGAVARFIHGGNR